jgi:uncharacterized membrane protein
VYQSTLVAISVAWASLVIATPRLAESSTGADIRIHAATFAYVIGSFICHQRPERTFHLRGLPLPVCGRCSGLYTGAAVILISLATVRPLRRRLCTRSTWWWRTVIAAGVVPTALTLVVEWVTPVPVSNTARALAGALAGAVVAAFLFASAEIVPAALAKEPEVN